MMTLRGRTTFAWQAADGPFYLGDCEDAAFLPPTGITGEMETWRLHAPATGLVVCTEGCLQQHVRIAIHDDRSWGHPPSRDREYGGETVVNHTH
jgi:hypothetical protein